MYLTIYQVNPLGIETDLPLRMEIPQYPRKWDKIPLLKKG